MAMGMECCKEDIFAMLKVSQEAWAWPPFVSDSSRLQQRVWVCFDVDHAGRRNEPIGILTDRKGLFNEVGRLACNLTIMDESSECVVIDSSTGQMNSFSLGRISKGGSPSNRRE
jgi:hypothetical protein